MRKPLDKSEILTRQVKKQKDLSPPPFGGGGGGGEEMMLIWKGNKLG